MTIRFFDRQDKHNDLNGTTFSDPANLVAVLESLKHRPAFFCELVGDNSYNLLVGVGSQCGCLQYSLSDGRPPYLMAVDKKPAGGSDYLDFLTGDTPTPVAGRYCLPFETVEKAAGHFLLTGERYPEVNWEEI
jgi:hypothetical protein